MNTASPSLGPAERLEGVVLSGKWCVQQQLRRDYGATGETRSCGYLAHSIDTKQLAFVKAFDFHRAELEGDTDHLEMMVREFNYERDVHKLVGSSRLSRVTRFYEAGKINIGGEAVHFIVCEWADGCYRELYPPGCSGVSMEQRFVSLRMIASSIAQLHGAGVAHQDIKPSNAVCFRNEGNELVKLTDLGSSSCRHIPPPPHDKATLVGQPNYAPYELLYRQPPDSWTSRRYGCDVYLLGNLCFTQFLGVSLTPLSLHCLPQNLRHTDFSGPYTEVVPHLIEAHYELVPTALRDVITDEKISEELTQLVLHLCHPDPEKRGRTRDLIRLDHVVSKLDLLARMARLSRRVGL